MILINGYLIIVAINSNIELIMIIFIKDSSFITVINKLITLLLIWNIH